MSPLVRRILLLALAGGVLFDALVPGNAAGVNAPLITAAFLGAALLAAGRDGVRRMDPADAWLAPTALVLAALPAIRADDWLVTVDLLFAAALAAGSIGCLAGGRVTRGLVPRVLEVAVGAVAAAAVGVISLLGTAGRSAPAASDDSGRSARIRARLRRAAPVARGVVIAVPIVAVFVALFASADAVFARYASEVLAWQPDVDLADLLGRSVVITLVAWGAAGLLGLGAGLLPALLPAPAAATERPAPSEAAPAARGEHASTAAGTPAGQGGALAQPPAAPATWAGAPGRGWSATTPGRPGAASGDAAWPGMPAAGWTQAAPWPADPAAPRAPMRLGSAEASTILLAVDALFGVFVALQLAYLFGGRDTLAVTGLTYAEYARRGFFDLVIVAVLAGGLAVTLDLAVARRTRLHVGGALMLLGLTAVILVSAFLRLRLYQDAYGWTELRFVVLSAILWLGVALAITAGLLATRRTPWVLHALGILVLAAIAAMNVVGPQAFVAERNLERAMDPSLVPAGGRTGLDADYLRELGDEAVVPVVDAWTRLGTGDRAALDPVLRQRSRELATAPILRGWPAWNLTRERAREALRGWEAAQGTASR